MNRSCVSDQQPRSHAIKDVSIEAGEIAGHFGRWSETQRRLTQSVILSVLKSERPVNDNEGLRHFREHLISNNKR